MFEVVSGRGSNASSDSIVNISSSGASSISTSSTTSTTSSHDHNLKAEVNKLREDKKILEGRIRGYRTLSDLLVTCRKEKDQLKAQLDALKTTLQGKPGMTDSQTGTTDPRTGTTDPQTGTADPQTGIMDPQTAANSPFSLVSLQAAQQRMSTSATSPPDISPLSLQDQSPKPHSPLKRSTSSVDPRGPPVSHPPPVGPSSSLQETVGPPGDSKETHLICLTSVNKPDPNPALQESVPRQESLEPGSGWTSVAGHDSLANPNSAPELLQPDSDKYDEAMYEKIGPQLGLGHAGISGSMYAAGGSSRAESRPTDFPSLSSSSISNGLAGPSSHGSVSNPPFMALSHQSLTGLTLNKPGSDLASEVENITERLHSEAGDSIAIAVQMHQIAERISKVEQKKRDQKKLIGTLMTENQDLKRLVKVSERTHQEEVVALREQNTRLIQQLKGQRPEEKSTAVKAPGSLGDWVHLEKPSQTRETPGGTDHSFLDRIRTLEQEKAELQRANTNWKNMWDKVEHSHQVKLGELRSTALLGEQEVAGLKARLAEQTSEFEERMLEMKRRLGEEESQKEEAQHLQRLAERRNSELQDQLAELRSQLSDTAREKQTLATELSILKAHSSGQMTQTSAATGSAANAASQAALEAEIGMLKEQLKVFAEDFEQERIDRTTAQSARDSAKKSAETIARQNQTLSSQVKHLQKQIKDRDDTISWTLRQNEGLQRQATDYKKKLAGEWEEKQSLQRRVLALEQQLQQLPQRNPYLSTNPATSSYAPLPVHQPPPPPPPAARTTMPYYGGHGAAAAAAGAAGVPRSRPLATTVSPEHLPGAWTCSACTYINYPGRTVCESCGLVNTPRSHPDQFGYASHDMYGSEHALLMSRGGDQTQGGGGGMMAGAGDLVVDSGPWIPPSTN